MQATDTQHLDLDLNEDQQAIADAVTRFCETRCDTETVKSLNHQFSAELWQELAAMGVLSPATPEGEGMGGALEICAISEALGSHVFPGPLAASFLATQVLPDNARAAIIEGSSVVSLSNIGDTLLPWGQHADIFLVVDGNDVLLASCDDDKRQAVNTLGAEPWARSSLTFGDQLDGAARGFILNDIATAAYLCAAGLKLVKEASDYAMVRKQFGTALGEFQAIAHPLADCQINLSAAETLARAAACCFDEGDMDAARNYSCSARLSASNAALQAAYTCHQVFAGIGITLEGPAFHISRRIRQLVSQPPGDVQCKAHLLQQVGLGTRD